MALPWLLHEDDDLLAAHKPAGINTHRADAFAQDGLYEWLRARAAREGAPAPAVLHRLDKETSGVLLFGKSAAANRALSEQLAERRLEKRYLLLAAHLPGRPARQRCDQRLPRKRRGGEREDQEAVTEFEVLERGAVDLVLARPRTGRTHQVRLHAARMGMPILGDPDYEGPPGARLFLHAAAVRFERPGGGPLELEAPLPESFARVLAGEAPASPKVAALAAWEARSLLADPEQSDCFLWIDRHHDGLPDVRVERLGDVGLVLRYDVRADGSVRPLDRAWTSALLEVGGLSALVEQRRPKVGAGGGPGDARPPAEVVAGTLREPRFVVREHGLRYWVDLSASATSSGLFLDQRETRRRLLESPLAGKQCLNAFAHTGSLSVAAAAAGAETLTLDLSRRYLDWARENLELNGIDPAAHDFLYGDAIEWLERLGKKGRAFDLVLLDPPSASTSGRRGKRRRWTVERDLGLLVERGARLVRPGGALYVSTNLKRLPWARFEALVAEGLQAAGRRPASGGALEPATVPLDHRTGPGDPPYLKAAWIQL